MLNRFSRHHDAVLHFFGVACPVLCTLSLLDCSGLLIWTWLLFLWLGIGHFVLFLCDNYPRRKLHPFAAGLFVFGVGMLWPLWLLRRLPGR